MKLIITSFFVFAISTFSFAQKKVVIMGSSTAFGSGASSYANSWAGKTEAYYNQNMSDGLDTIFYNIAAPAYDTYQEMPTGFVPPVGRPLPDDAFNVTKALSYAPDIVIINLPSNDINYGYAKSEMMFNLRLMSATIFATGTTKCFVATPQPRNDLSQDFRDSLLTLVDSINNSFGLFAINFWDCLVTTDGLSMLKDVFRAIPSPLHVNDLGHNELFLKVIDKDIFGTVSPVSLQLRDFRAQSKNNTVLLNWHTEQQGPNCIFDLQRSADMRNFTTLFTRSETQARQSANYTGVDETPLPGKSYYRLKMNEAGRISYSPIINITTEGKALNISKLSVDNGGSKLTMEINIQKSQFVSIVISGSNGATLMKQKEFITQPGNIVGIPIGALAAGQYFMRVFTADGTSSSIAFRK